MKSPFISIIIPSYNHAKFLEERIESVINQSYKNYEIIILDDCSIDNSCKIIETYRLHEKVVHIEYNKTNSGSPFQQWEKGIKMARGEWVWIAESDDVANVKFLEKSISKINKNTAFVYCKSYIINENNELLSDTTVWLSDLSKPKWNSDFNINGESEFFNYHAYKNVVSNTSSVLFRKSLIKKIKHYPNDYKTNGDWLFFAQLSLLGEISYINEPLSYWRQHNKTTRNIFSLDYEYDKLKENTRIINVFNQLAKKYNRKLDYNKYEWLLDWWLRRFSYSNLRNTKYVFPPLPNKLLVKFYLKIIKRFFLEAFKSLKNKVHDT